MTSPMDNARATELDNLRWRVKALEDCVAWPSDHGQTHEAVSEAQSIHFTEIEDRADALSGRVKALEEKVEAVTTITTRAIKSLTDALEALERRIPA